MLIGIRPRRALFACALLSTPLAAVPASAPAAKPAKTKKATFADAVVRQVNVQRRLVGVRPLRRSRPLTRVAGAHVGELGALGRLDHTSADGTPMSVRVQRAVGASAVGETLAWLPPTAADAPAVIAAWMASPSHRASLLSPTFARIGVARRPTPAGVFVGADLASAR